MENSIGFTSLVLSLLALTLVIASHTQQPARPPAAGIAGDTWGGILDEFVGPDIPNNSPPKAQPPQSIPGDQPVSINPSGSHNPQLSENLPFIAPQTSAIEGHECNSLPVGAPDDRDQCAVGLRKIIYAFDCADKSQNAAVGGILAQTVLPGTKTSTTIDNDCCVIFWTGELTEEGAKTMRATKGVLAVVPDVTFREDYTSTPYFPSQKRDEINPSGLALEGRYFVKRDTIVRQKGLTAPDLSFISAPEGISASDCDYVYRSAAGEGTFVYVIDAGVDIANAEFSSGVIKRWLYAYDTYPVEKAVLYKHGSGHGSCVASKVAGQLFGVAKKTSLIIVKSRSELSSFMDSITEVLNDVRRLAISGEYKPGYNIVTMQQGYRGPTEIDKWSKVTITRLISKLISRYGIAIVSSAGNTGDGTVGFPASLSPQLPIIVVGSTDEDGIQLPESTIGPKVIVSAPGTVLCADNKPGPYYQIASGASFAAPAVAGLAAYYLSLPDTGPKLRNRPTELIPRAVMDYIVETAYVRPGSTVLSAWNLLNGAKPLSPT